MPLSEDTEAALIQLVRSVAKAEILPRFRRLAASDVSAKTGPEDLVTQADLHAETAITAGVRTLMPEALIVGEEAVEDEPGLLNKLLDAPLAVILDPVDGTWNFAKGLTTFGVILAVVEEGETIFGLLYDPVMDDWVVTRRGGGTWYVTPNRASRRLTLSQNLGEDLTGFVGLFHYPRRLRLRLADDLPDFRRIWSVRCSCHEYRVTTLGGADFVLSNALKPWDHAAGALAVAEAGGAVALLDGRAYRASITSGSYLVSARSEDVLQRVQSTMRALMEDE